MATATTNNNSIQYNNNNITNNNNTNLATTTPGEPPIWAARNVDWPILSSLSPNVYQKLVQQSQALGNEYGISYQPPLGGGGIGGGGSSLIHSAHSGTASSSKPIMDSGSMSAHSGGIGGIMDGGADHSSSTSTYGLTGFMNRVLNTSGTDGKDGMDTTSSLAGSKGSSSAAGKGSSISNVSSSNPMMMGGGGGGGNNNNNSNRPLRPPRAHCVAAANGWIVAVLESQANFGNNNNASASSQAGQQLLQQQQLQQQQLRLISRWNVRRGSLTGTSLSDQWMALPPAIVTGQKRYEGRIKHVLVDPTASHTLVSANNGEAYYLHSSGTQRLIKLPGFGPSAPSFLHEHNNHSSKKKTTTTAAAGVASSSTPTRSHAGSSSGGAGSSGSSSGATSTGSSSAAAVAASVAAGLHLTGIPATAVANRRDEQSQASIQAGLTAGSYVTAIAWDKERGTEGSSKRVLLGTSLGEIYEYTFPNNDDESEHPPGHHHHHPSSRKGGSDKGDKNAPLFYANLPILLHKLSADANDPAVDQSQVGAAVTGLYFERLRTGLLVLCATSGRRKRTRFHSFYSPHNSSFRAVMADQQYATLVELPGSVDFADMVTVADVFALRTAVGIYYGRVDKSLTNAAASLAAGGSSMIVDSGILSYEAIHAKQQQQPSGSSNSSSNAMVGSSTVPISLALTPHHFIILTESNHVCFINRVAQKIIQKDRVDVQSTQAKSASGSSIADDASTVTLGALLMDIRRPDQVWLRQGRHLVHISSSQEDRDVWKYTLQKCLDMPILPKSSGSASSAGVGARAEQAGFDVFVGKPLTEEEKAQEALFEQAKALCSNAAQKAVVTAARAEYHLSQGRAELAAKYFALCPSALAPFPDTAVRLALPKLGVNDPKSYGGSAKAWASLEASNVPLITYLADKMRVGKMNDDRMTCTMIGAWLTELYLHERGERRASAPLMESSSNPAGTPSIEDSALLAQFLNNNVNNMEAKTIMKILTSHDVGAHECALYAARSGDIATAVNAALNVGSQDTRGAYEALTILGDAPFELAEPLYYRHASILLSRAPGAAVDGFLVRYAEGLSPSRLLPSIMNYEQRRASQARARSLAGTNDHTDDDEEKTVESYDVRMDNSTVEGLELRINRTMILTTASFVEDANAAIRFLEGVIQQGCRTSAIFSYLVSLYAKLEDEEPLLKFLTIHVPGTSAWTDATTRSLLAGDRTGGAEYGLSGPLDMSAALRTVLASGRHYRSAIKLYMGFGMRQQAVELALKVDPSLARELAQESVELEERKRLWLMIAKNAASDSASRGGKDVVSRVVSVLKDCGPDVLSIEDVLPFLPDFAQIDQIKDEICEALTSYSSRIEGFLREMSDCDHTCENLRQEITRLKNRQMRVKTNARCAITDKLVLQSDEPFYVFPSGYVILASAVKKAVMPHLNEKQRARVEELEEELQKKPTESILHREKLQAELDGLIAAECPLTGTVMIESIDRGFESGDDLDFGSRGVERAEV
ncbi:hypothetical protein ACA910_000630 [Epithemia clementina (nom. ined.)]